MKKFTFTCLLFLCFILVNCNNQEKKDINSKQEKEVSSAPLFKLSLAQWSLHKYVIEENGSPFDFASQAKSMGFEGLEYVSQLYKKNIEELGFNTVIDSLITLSETHDISNVLIMVDNEGNLADPDETKRNEAVEKHKRWIDAAQKMGCHSIRVNTFGTNDPEIWKTSVVDGLKKLSKYAATKNISVLCENHGWLSSDADKLMIAINEVNMENCGTLPDFGNWCIKRKAGERWGECLETYPDKYDGIKKLMAAAQAVSAKSYDFDDNGNETTIDYAKMMQIVKNAGYNSFVGVEYEGNRLSEKKGIIATRDLLLKVAKELK